MTGRSPARCDVLVAGEYFCDLIFDGLSDQPALGREIHASRFDILPGGAFTMALACTRLGLATQWAADFGTDLISRHVLDCAAREGLDPARFTLRDHPLPRLSAAFTGAGERGFLTYSAAPVVPPEALGPAPRWLLQSFRHCPDWLAFQRSQRAAGAEILLDAHSGGEGLESPSVREVISLASIFSPNEAEALALTGTASLPEAAAMLVKLCPTVIVKCGAAGALIATPTDQLRLPAPKVPVCDTVGAGDTFNAGLLCGLLSGLDLPAATRRAIAAASLKVTRRGGMGCPTRDELAAFEARAALNSV